MKLILTTPAEILIRQDTTKIIAEGTHGSFCLLPRHIDFLAMLVPGLLAWEDLQGEEHFAAVGQAILVKRSNEVMVSAMQATRSGKLADLQATVRHDFMVLDERQRAAHAAAAKLEASFLRRTMAFTDQRAQTARTGR